MVTTQLVPMFMPNNKNLNNDLNSSIEGQVATMSQKMNQLQIDIQLLHKAVEDMNVCKNRYDLENVATFSDVEKKIADALVLYDADKNGLIDYALESAGGSIISTPNTKSHPSNVNYHIFGSLSFTINSNPRTILQPEILPGNCYAFYGSNGTFVIKLATDIVVDAVSLEHTHRKLLDDVTTAPKNFTIRGLHNEKGEGAVLGQFFYNASGNALQTFWINKTLNTESYGIVELHISSNYGHPVYTCVYRFRVHGFKK